MSSEKPQRVFTFKLVDVDSNLQLELTNNTSLTLKRIEVLTVFLKDETTPGGPSLAHISFEPLELIKPLESAIVRHRTWGDGKAIAVEQDQLKRLELVPGKPSPYVLDISWQDADGKSRFQRIPVGH